MDRRPWLISAALLVSIGLYGGAALLTSNTWWGLNHLRFLPWPFLLLYALCSLLIAILAFNNRITNSCNTRLIRLANWAYDHTTGAALLIATFLGVLFWVGRLHTQFLGDGYTVLSVFSNREFFAYKFSELGSIIEARSIQALLGSYGRESTVLAFQILSIAAGIVTIFNFVQVSRRIGSTVETFALNLSCLIFSGALLLFFGYVEYYPAVWALAALLLNAALCYLQTGRGLWIVILVFALMSFTHLQALIWLPGVCYLVVADKKKPWFHFKVTRLVGAAAFALITLLLAVTAWYLLPHFDLNGILLPLLSGPPSAPDYAVFTAKHLVDIFNESLLIVPALLVLMAITAISKKRCSATHIFLLLLCFGSCAFLLLVDPGLGMARDWDLMSLTMLAPLLLLLNLISTGETHGWPIPVTAICLLSATAVTLYCGTLSISKSSEDRFFGLLNYYGGKDKAGWIILSSYYYDKKDWSSQESVRDSMTQYFPDEALLARAFAELHRHQYQEAYKLAEHLFLKDSTRGDCIQVFAAALTGIGKYERAVDLYTRTLRKRPYFADGRKDLGLVYLKMNEYDRAREQLKLAWKWDNTLTSAAEGIALSYLKQRQFDSALVYAHELFERDSNSPGGHLIEMTADINQGDLKNARTHYEQYLLYGSKRTDYDDIRSYYGPYFK